MLPNANTRLSIAPVLTVWRGIVLSFSAALSFVRPCMHADRWEADDMKMGEAFQVAIHACVLFVVSVSQQPKMAAAADGKAKNRGSRHSHNRQSSKECVHGGIAARTASWKEMVAY